MARARIALMVLLVAGVARAEVGAAAEAEAKAHFKAGNLHYDAGAIDKAVDEYRAALRIVPRPILHYNLGQCYRLQGKKREAVEQYGEFLKLQPEGKGSAEAREHVAALTRALDEEQRKLAPVPVEPPPVPATPPPEVKHAPVAATQPPPPSRPRRWPIGVGVGVAVVVAGAALGIGLGVGTQPSTSFNVTDGVHMPTFQ
jgi:hypothetical protein